MCFDQLNLVWAVHVLARRLATASHTEGEIQLRDIRNDYPGHPGQTEVPGG